MKIAHAKGMLAGVAEVVRAAVAVQSTVEVPAVPVASTAPVATEVPVAPVVVQVQAAPEADEVPAAVAGALHVVRVPNRGCWRCLSGSV